MASSMSIRMREHQAERRLDLALGDARRQVQQPDVMAIGAIHRLGSECIVRPTEDQIGEEVVVIAVVRKSAGLAHE